MWFGRVFRGSAVSFLAVLARRGCLDYNAPMFKRKKRIYLINREFQLRHTRVALTVGFVSTLMTMGLILYPLFYLQIVRFPYFLPLPFIVGIALAASLNFAFVTAFGIITTHRIAGPMFSLVRHLHQLRLGQNPAELRVREDDDLKFVIRNVNEFLDFLNSRTVADQSRMESILGLLQKEAGNALAIAEAKEFRDELTKRLPQRDS
jgi:hypothetical protein